MTDPIAPDDPILGGDVLVFEALGSAGVTDVVDAVDRGFLAFTDAGTDGTAVDIDFDGGSDSFEIAVTLQGSPFVDADAAQDNLADNIEFALVS